MSLAQSRIAETFPASKPLASGGNEVQFGTGLSGGDWLGWMLSLIDWVDRKEAHPILRPRVAAAETLAGDFAVGITADWGTGFYGAPKIAESIRKLATTRKFDLLMHLGDIYYSGTKREAEERFLNMWPKNAGTINRALNR